MKTFLRQLVTAMYLTPQCYQHLSSKRRMACSVTYDTALEIKVGHFPTNIAILAEQNLIARLYISYGEAIDSL